MEYLVSTGELDRVICQRRPRLPFEDIRNAQPNCVCR